MLFDDIEEDAMVGPLLGEADQLLMEHGGDENGSTEVQPTHYFTPLHLVTCTLSPLDKKLTWAVRRCCTLRTAQGSHSGLQTPP